MEGWIRRLFLSTASGALIGVVVAVNAFAQPPTRGEPVIEPQLNRPVTPLPAIDTENFEVGVYAGVLSIEDFGSDAVIGARAAYHLNSAFFFEGSYGQSQAGSTSYENLSGAAKLLTGSERDYRYYNLSLGYNVLPGEAFIGERWAFNSALYLIGGAGSTHFGGDDRFTVNVGAGYRFIATDWMALHLDVRDHMFNTDLLGEKKTVHNLEFTGAVTVFF
jgi:outer membrane beta-barrel protein